MNTEQLNYQYAGFSALDAIDDSENLFLSNFNENTKGDAPCLFWGRLNDPYILSRCLITLSRIVQSSFNLSPAEIAMLRDPIVTAGNEQIRFEGFSHCAGVYARVDILEDGQNGEFIENGTTNVDFNPPLIAALARIQKNEKLVLSIGKKEVGFHKDGESIIERKVPLPTKWIKGLNTVQHYYSESEAILTLTKIQTIQLFKSLPTGQIKTDFYLIKRGTRFMFSPLKSKAAICIGGIHRLKLVNALIPMIDKLSIYQHRDQQSSNFILHFGKTNFTISLSRNFWRGFSGEGAGLENLLEDLPIDLITAFDNYAYANQIFNPDKIASKEKLDLSTVDKLAAKLAAIGLLGFDLLSNNYFYRRLPFKLSRILTLNPRLKNAEKLILENKVEITSNVNGDIEAKVAGSGVFHYVVLKGDFQKCSCLWYSKNQGERGACKHILATKKLAQLK